MNTIAIMLVMGLSFVDADATSAQRHEASVEAAGKALQPRFGYPWYDAETDDLQRVDLSVRRPSAEWSVSLSWLQFLAWALLAFVLAGIILLLIRAYQIRMRPTRVRRTLAKPGEADRIEALPFPVESGLLDLLAEARRQYEQGRYGQAIIYLFSYQLVQLDKRQIIRLARGKTDRQYLRELGPRADLRKIVERTMLTFEDVFFGGRTIDRATFEAAWLHVDEFETLIGT